MPNELTVGNNLCSWPFSFSTQNSQQGSTTLDAEIFNEELRDSNYNSQSGKFWDNIEKLASASGVVLNGGASNSPDLNWYD